MRRDRAVVVAAATIAVFVAIVGAWGELRTHVRIDQIGHTGAMIAGRWRATFADWRLWVLAAAIAILEWRFPARRGEGLLREGAALDVVHFAGFAVLQLTVIRVYFVLLDGLASVTVPGIGDHLDRRLGTVATVLVVLVVADFLNWATHLVKHRVPWLWPFHEVHHSQRSLSMLTVTRQHFMEAIIASTLAFIPVALLGASFDVVAGTVTLALFFDYFQHSNIRTDLGPLRHVFVTPQSHRVHHSVDPAHHDTNFGVVLSVWDRLFGTRSFAGRDEYPATGVDDRDFPIEQGVRPVELLETYGRQMVYPFRAAYRTVRRRGLPQT